jgi:copper chaperone CopZ
MVIAVAGAIVSVLLTSVVACGGNGNGEEVNEIRTELENIQGSLEQLQASLEQLQTVQTSLDEISESLTRAEVVAVMGFLSGIGFHDIDEDLQAASELPPFLKGRITRARQVVEGTNWPDPLREHAEELIAALRSFEAALDKGDLAQSKGLASEAHDVWHDLEGVAYPFLASEEAAEHGDDDSHGGGEEHAEEDGDDHG